MSDAVMSPEPPPRPEPWSPVPGAVLGGRYMLRAVRGTGGMGTVWEAEHLTLKRPMAVKFLTVAQTEPGALRERFLREARAAAAVRHRNVVDIIDFGATVTGQPYMVMELLEGRSLGARLDDPAPITIAEIARIATGVLAGLEAVHTAGLLHGDIKPDNVFLVREVETELPKLLDFGVSRAQRGVGEGRQSVVPSVEGLVLGTPAYMSPEQARGETNLDARSDVYSTGVLLYELFSGSVPFDAANPAEVVAQVLRDEPVPLESRRPDLPRGVVDVVLKAMAKDKARRFASAKDMRSALVRALSDAFSARPLSPDAIELMRAIGDAYEPGDSGVVPLVTEDDLKLLAAARSMPTLEAGPSPTSVAREAPRSRSTLRIAGGTVALLCGVALFAALWGAMHADPQPVATSLEVSSPRALPPAPPLGRVAVELASLPAGALVYIDGQLAGPPFALPVDGQAHTIEVRADGFDPWTITHVASAPVRLDVRSVPRVTAAPAPTVSEREPPPRRAPRGGTAAGRLIRDPDF